MALFAELLAVGIDADARGGDAAAFATQCEGGADDCRQADPCPFAFAPRQSLRRVNQWRRIAMSSRVRPRLESCSSSSFLSHVRMRCFPGSSRAWASLRTRLDLALRLLAGPADISCRESCREDWIVIDVSRFLDRRRPRTRSQASSSAGRKLLAWLIWSRM